MGMWPKYVPVGVRKARAEKELLKQRKKGVHYEPVCISGRTIVHRFWGMKWCDHVETFSDFNSRLPRGRSYVRNGSVMHLSIFRGGFESIVSGSSLYSIKGSIEILPQSRWEKIKHLCNGGISSMLELLEGQLSNHIMEVVSNHTEGLFPRLKEMKFKCDCPDWAGMCKHVAAVLYGIGHRLDSNPELLFLLRGVDPKELINTTIPIGEIASEDQLASDDLGALFNIELDVDVPMIKKEAPARKKTKLHKLTGVSGVALKELRKRLSLSLKDWAELLHVTPADVQHWEKSDESIQVTLKTRNQIMLILCEKFNV